MEGTPQGRLVLQLGGGVPQRRHRLLAVGHHLGGLLQEDIQQVAVEFVVGRHRCSGGGRHRDGRGHGLTQIDQGLGTRSAILTHHGLGCLPGGLGNPWLFSQRGLVSDLLQLLTEQRQIHTFLNLGDHTLHASADRLGILLRGFEGGRDRLVAPHEGNQLTLVLVESEHLLGQGWLIVQHVDQETQGAEVVAQLAERAGLPRLGFVHIRVDHLIDDLAHAADSLHRLVQAQHRQHAPHLGELVERDVQPRFFHRVAEELIERLLGFCQRHLQLPDHAAKRLAVAHPAIELLHPGFQRLRRTARQESVQAHRQGLGAFRQLGIGGIEILKGSLQVQRRGGHFHRQLGLDAVGVTDSLLDGTHQGLCQKCAARQQLEQRVGNQSELIGDLTTPAGISTRVERPRLLGGIDALACLQQQRRVVASQGGLRVVHGPQGREVEGITHRLEMLGGPVAGVGL